MNNELEEALSAPVARRRPGRPPASKKAAITSPAPVAQAVATLSVDLSPEALREMELEAMSAKALADGKVRAALAKSGVSQLEQETAPTVQKWIFNANIENISPQMGNFVPRGMEGIFVYTPLYPVTGENKAEHIELCKQRVNTVYVNPTAGTKFDLEKVGEGLMARPQPMTPNQVPLTAESDSAL